MISFGLFLIIVFVVSVSYGAGRVSKEKEIEARPQRTSRPVYVRKG